jgi:hypothetical protein
MQHKTMNLIAAVATLALGVSSIAIPLDAAAAAPAPAATIVTRENFVRAETDRMFADIPKLAGGVNRLFIIRTPTPLNKQIIVRMNRDTLYAGAVIDASKGGTITLPPSPDGRYMSLHFMDNDHYDLGVISKPGTHPLPANSGHIAAAVRIQVYNPNDPQEIALINAWQDKLAINAKSARPFVPGNWDSASLNAVRAELETGSRRFPNMEKAMLPRGKADPEQRLYGAACCWGLLPAVEATYITYSGGHPVDECRTATFPVPKNRAFWSITVYNEKGFIAYENSVLNSSTVKLNPDGTFTAYFGSKEVCGDKANRLDIPPGWNTMMRVYRPDPSVLNGGYVLPATTPVKR